MQNRSTPNDRSVAQKTPRVHDTLIVDLLVSLTTINTNPCGASSCVCFGFLIGLGLDPKVINYEKRKAALHIHFPLIIV